jgi:hypothetical protein
MLKSAVNAGINMSTKMIAQLPMGEQVLAGARNVRDSFTSTFLTPEYLNNLPVSRNHNFTEVEMKKMERHRDNLVKILKLGEDQNLPRELRATTFFVDLLERVRAEVISDALMVNVAPLKISSFEEMKVHLLSLPFDVSGLDKALKIKTQKKLYGEIMEWIGWLERR